MGGRLGKGMHWKRSFACEPVLGTGGNGTLLMAAEKKTIAPPFTDRGSAMRSHMAPSSAGRRELQGRGGRRPFL